MNFIITDNVHVCLIGLSYNSPRNENLNLKSESNSWIYFDIFLDQNWKIYWSEQSFTGLGPLKTGAHHEDCYNMKEFKTTSKFYWKEQQSMIKTYCLWFLYVIMWCYIQVTDIILTYTGSIYYILICFVRNGLFWISSHISVFTFNITLLWEIHSHKTNQWWYIFIQGFQYFSSVPVLHYLQVVVFIKILAIFINILYNTL